MWPDRTEGWMRTPIWKRWFRAAVLSCSARAERKSRMPAAFWLALRGLILRAGVGYGMRRRGASVFREALLVNLAACIAVLGDPCEREALIRVAEAEEPLLGMAPGTIRGRLGHER